jgi:hypothetical protein
MGLPVAVEGCEGVNVENNFAHGTSLIKGCCFRP